jgi:hypothetical protein
VVTIPAPIKLSTNPARDICGTLTQSLPNTIALGGVATGNMKAKDAANVAGTINNSGWILPAIAENPIIGRIMVVVAVLDVNSVKNVTTRQMVRIISHRG